MTDTVSLLCEMIRYQSVSGAEAEVLQFLHRVFAQVADEVALVPLPLDLPTDPDYSTPIPGLTQAGRHNLVARVRGTGAGRSVIFNTHADVVPATKSWKSAFAPEVADGFVRGRGACDAKGQIASLWSALKRLRLSGRRLRGDIIVHIVVEEENGGNGTLALVREGVDAADGVVVLEPTDLRLATASRGAVWFRAICHGQAHHVGNLRARGEGTSPDASALKAAIAVMNVFESYHAELLAGSRAVPLFDAYDNPMPLVFGRLEAGTWPATVPARAVLEGVLGFLPNVTKERVMAGLRTALSSQGWAGSELRSAGSGRCELEFTFRHDGFITPQDAPVAAAMALAIFRHGGVPDPMALPASSDAWLYNNRLRVPTITFGVGKLSDAHTDREQVAVDDLDRATDILYDFMSLFVG